MIADELRRQADAFVELQDLLPDIGRLKTPGAAPNARVFDQ